MLKGDWNPAQIAAQNLARTTFMPYWWRLDSMLPMPTDPIETEDWFVLTYKDDNKGDTVSIDVRWRKAEETPDDPSD